MITTDLSIMLHALKALDREFPGPAATVRKPQSAAQELGKQPPAGLQPELSDVCTDCNDTGVREHNSQMVVCWCEAGDARGASY